MHGPRARQTSGTAAITASELASHRGCLDDSSGSLPSSPQSRSTRTRARATGETAPSRTASTRWPLWLRTRSRSTRATRSVMPSCSDRSTGAPSACSNSEYGRAMSSPSSSRTGSSGSSSTMRRPVSGRSATAHPDLPGAETRFHARPGSVNGARGAQRVPGFDYPGMIETLRPDWPHQQHVLVVDGSPDRAHRPGESSGHAVGGTPQP